MEAWFISQPQVLNDFFGVDSRRRSVSDKLPKRKPSEIPDPKGELMNATKSSRRGPYHLVKHASDLLTRLDPVALATSFGDFRALIQQLSNEQTENDATL